MIEFTTIVLLKIRSLVLFAEESANLFST